MENSPERNRKAEIGRAVASMRDSAGYKFVMQRIEERCGSGKWWKAWIHADDKVAAELRARAQGYLAFDALVQEMINEGQTAVKILEKETQKGIEMLRPPKETHENG